ncbi:hypothetical protein A3C21_03340 [Candidatus Kaiserbacteria bacterium RIFCSPHIGHO2_02_FULL_59_21]|uniref:PIN domain-containing protein n=2 Tax=Candidatus Kaiseribacteriota TaxID=1752734 RepID=A0A0G2B176_9BACT|nr:MAG: hypothetical protein UY98_C0008G0017 [Candidatus Kaiserbacteria bacterium GW2011_GWA2_58_9]OGG63044.1 MAG: hypothetical protein A2766_04275 [Candidatus Kaiserbacteria bacterium RIFCSPHIGHO2_01_FULL_58_22]OGG66692.1 MAG: hypothetical protein A3C21_03340 [Candidatus Kaiserbacteria bacterium RIFCSPHIGHO2_02_FULL_59_21]OGG79518.1 MAG: hypothetical protein A2952_00060 [Candidatus Kaiserbacteria bacterium RIFCSPLOWO2_01_FULL_59_34]OGG84442.1 MAG: hypothetical protein A3I47_02190 [Candidatus K
MAVVVDSSVLVAALHREDTLHERGKSALEGVEKPIAIPEYIVVETATTLARVAGKKVADVFVRSLFDTKDMDVVPSSPEQFATAAAAFLSSNSKLSFVDCALLQFSRTYRVITFDKALSRAIEASKRT